AHLRQLRRRRDGDMVDAGDFDHDLLLFAVTISQNAVSRPGEGPAPPGPSGRHIRCSRRRTDAPRRASAPAPGSTARPGSGDRATRTAWCPRTLTAPKP